MIGRKEKNSRERAADGRIIFNPTLTDSGGIGDTLRAFTGESQEDMRRSAARRPPREHNVWEEEVEAYTDGSAINNGAANAKAGAGVWFGANDPRNLAVRVPGNSQTNQAAEIYAVIAAAATVPPFAPLHLVTDSTHVMDGLTKHVEEWEDKGWSDIKNGPLFAEATARLRARSAQTTLRWVKGHNNNEGNGG